MKAFEAENSILVKYNGFTFFKKNQNRCRLYYCKFKSIHKSGKKFY